MTRRQWIMLALVLGASVVDVLYVIHQWQKHHVVFAVLVGLALLVVLGAAVVTRLGARSLTTTSPNQRNTLTHRRDTPG